ncbi:hypothetical protein FRC20_011309 [Serendipita sp. 405]|nr:hypothetical protein FRC20_011309 [Serendipita sp. 405]
MWGAMEDPKVFKSSQLPIEIWMVIIEFVLDEYRRPYLYCTAETFPQFQLHLSWCNRFNDLGKVEILGYWRNIRAVSRLWNHLARGPPYLILNDAHDHVPKGTSSILIKEKTEFSSFIQRALDDPNLTLNVTTIAFVGYRADNKAHLLFNNANLFPVLKCLMVDARFGGGMLWRHVGRAFPHLVALSVRTAINEATPEESMVLEKLEVLSLDGALPPGLVLPSLKHIYIPNCPDLSHILWKNHGHQVESLLVTGATRKWQAQIWETFPNIKVFGDRSYCDIPGPPDHHPLQYLPIFSESAKSYEQTTSIVSRFPGITHLHITHEFMEDADLNKLLEFCQEKSLEVVSAIPLRWKSCTLMALSI